MTKLLYWSPRFLSILFIIFISLFAFDVFDQQRWFLALLIHLTPSFILIFVTLIAWKNEKLGGIIFIATGIIMQIIFHLESLIISAPAITIGSLFLVNSLVLKNKNRFKKDFKSFNF